MKILGLNQLWAAITAQAQLDWQVSPRAVALLLAAPFIASFVVAGINLGYKPLIIFLEQEDGFFEWLQVLSFASAAIACGFLTRYHQVARRPLAMAANAFVCVALIFVIGEELSWGQRLLKFQTPEVLAAANYKQEFSVHNITSLTDLFVLAKIFVGLYGVLGAAWLLHLRKTGRDVAWRPFLLPAFLVSPFIIVLIMRFARLTVLKSSVPAGFDEFEEAVLAVGVASFCLLAWRFQSASQRRL